VSRAPLRRSGLDGMWTNAHAVGAKRSQTRTSLASIVSAEGGGFTPTLFLGGGAGFSRILGLSMVGSERLVDRAAPAPEGGLA
jgi:hypothetical protein